MDNNQQQIMPKNASAFMPKDAAAVEILNSRAQLLAQEIIKTDEKTKTLDFIRFCLAEQQCFGIAFEEAREVFSATKITALPLAPYFIGGVINYRGKFIPVIDLAKLFSLASDEKTALNYLIIIELAGITAAISAKEIQTSVSCDESELDPALMSTKIKPEYIRGIYAGTTAILKMNIILKFCQDQMKQLELKLTTNSNRMK